MTNLRTDEVGYPQFVNPKIRQFANLLRQDRLPADLEGGDTTKSDGAAVRGDHLDPQCILVLEVRGVAGRAQRIEAGLLGCRVAGAASLKEQADAYDRRYTE